MGIKQRRLVPGRDYNYGEAQLVEAAEDITANQIVILTGRSGVMATAQVADATDPALCRGRLMVAKHDALKGQKLVVLPWKIVPWSAPVPGVPGGVPVYLTTDGSFNAFRHAGSVWSRQVGQALDDEFVLLDPNLEAGSPSGANAAASGTGANLRVFALDTSGPEEVGGLESFTIIDAWVVITTGGNTENFVVANDGNPIVSVATGTVSAGDVVRADAIDTANATLAPGGKLEAGFTGSTLAGIAYILAIPG